LQNKLPGVAEGNVMGVGAMIMYDYAMAGIVKSTYASLNLSYSIKLSEEPSIHRLTAGFGGSYGKRFVDFSRLDFEEQFTGFGFNTSLPTGEVALYNMKGYFSVNSGLTYSIRSEKRNFDIGVAAFHLNKPKQTFLKDENERLAMREVIHANFETYLNDYLVLNVNAIYQNQDRARYYSAGGAVGYFFGEQQDMMINAGLWYWSKNAVIPYVGLVYKDMQFGFSYDATISSLKEARRKPSTWEFSVIIRGVKDPTGIIPGPCK
jgi:type IX secretion system PorP/SprF family membrane protein